MDQSLLRPGGLVSLRTMCLLALLSLGMRGSARADELTERMKVYPPNDGPYETTASRKGTFVIESYGGRADHHWVVRREGGKVVEGVQLPPAEETGDGRGTGCGYMFSISPDEQWILADMKLYHGANATWLYHREKGPKLRFSLVQPSFSVAAWRYREKMRGEKVDFEQTFIFRAGPWPKGNGLLRLTLWDDRKLWACCFDLAALKFVPSKDQTTNYLK